MSKVICCQIRNCGHPLAESFRGEPVYLCKEHQEKYNKKEPMTLTGNWEDCSINYGTERKGVCVRRGCDNDRNPNNSCGFCAKYIYSTFAYCCDTDRKNGALRYHNDQNTIHSVPTDIELKLRSAEECEPIASAAQCASCSASFGLTCWRYSCCYCGCCNCSSCVPETTEYRGQKIRLCPKCAFTVTGILAIELCKGCKKHKKPDDASGKKFCNFCVFQRRKIVFLLQLKSRVRKWHGVPWQVQLLVAQYVFTEHPAISYSSSVPPPQQMMSKPPVGIGLTKSSLLFKIPSVQNNNDNNNNSKASLIFKKKEPSTTSQNDGDNNTTISTFTSSVALGSLKGPQASLALQNVANNNSNNNVLSQKQVQSLSLVTTGNSGNNPLSKFAVAPSSLTKVQQTLLEQERERNEELGKQLRILQAHSSAVRKQVDSLQQQVDSANKLINQQAQQLSSKDSELKLEVQQVNLLQGQLSMLEKQNKELQKLALAAEEKEEEKNENKKRIQKEEAEFSLEDDEGEAEEGESKKK